MFGDDDAQETPELKRHEALQRKAFLTRDGEVLDSREKLLTWLVDHGDLPEMYRPPAES